MSIMNDVKNAKFGSGNFWKKFMGKCGMYFQWDGKKSRGNFTGNQANKSSCSLDLAKRNNEKKFLRQSELIKKKYRKPYCNYFVFTFLIKFSGDFPQMFSYPGLDPTIAFGQIRCK